MTAANVQFRPEQKDYGIPPISEQKRIVTTSGWAYNRQVYDVRRDRIRR